MNKDLKNAKRDFFKAGLQHSLENAKTLWNDVKNHLGWKSGGEPETLKIEGKKELDPERLAEKMKDTFSKKLKKVEEELGEPAGNHLQVIRNMTRGRCRIFGFQKVTREEVLLQIRKAPNKSSFGIDEIGYDILKLLDIYIAEPLMEIINLCLTIQEYPSR